MGGLVSEWVGGRMSQLLVLIAGWVSVLIDKWSESMDISGVVDG